jgi:hypothetical protein
MRPSITCTTTHEFGTPMLSLASAIASAMSAVKVRPIAWTTRGLDTEKPGGLEQLSHHVEVNRLDDDGYFAFRGPDNLIVTAWRAEQFARWLVEAYRDDDRKPDANWLRWMVEFARLIIEAPGFRQVQVHRNPLASVEFPLSPPFAAANHAVTVTEAEVNEAYEDPRVFWQAWDQVEPHGELRLCTRALDALDDVSWLAHTFESTMAMAREARPGKTRYGRVFVADWMAPWWEFGDLQDEKAGEPVLIPVGYDPATRTAEYAGYVPPGHHALIREIHTIRVLAGAKKDRQGRPIDIVRVVFAEEAMARAERRPLLDVGARVYFTDPTTGALVEITD